MNLYTNTIAFDPAFGFGKEIKDDLIPVGSTFALVAVNTSGYLLKPPKNSNYEFVQVMPEIFKAAFKEVELTE